jgi:HlyD family secretion protein
MNYSNLLLSVIFCLAACQKQPETARVTAEKITESVYASGIVKSKNQYQVFSTVNGLIQNILVREGDLVKKGDPLLIIQHETPRLQTENAKLQADFADWNLRGDRLAELRAAIETARARMLNDSLLLDRQRGLWAQQIGSKVELEQRELAFANAQNAFQSAIFRRNDLQKQLAFAAEQTKQLLSISKNMAGDYVVRSQTGGRVYNIGKVAGEIVDAQTPVAVIGDADDFVAELQIDENDIVRIRAGQRVLLTMDSYKGQVFEAVVSKIDPLMNERTRTFTVEADFVKKPPVLYPNLTAEANIVLQFKENALTVPRRFLLFDSMVILENGEKRPVEIGLKDYQKAEVLRGLSVGQIIQKPEK